MKRMIRAASLHRLSVFEEDDLGQQNRVNLDDSNVDTLIQQALAEMKTGRWLPNVTTLDAFVNAVNEYNDSPGAWSIVQVKFDGQVIAGLEDDETV